MTVMNEEASGYFKIILYKNIFVLYTEHRFSYRDV